MSTYWFELQIGPVQDLEEAADRLYSRCGDAMLAGDTSGGTVDFSREARNAIEAVLTAITDTEQAGLQVTGVVEDLVTVDDIAERAGRTSQAVSHWITNTRGPGGFPAPVLNRMWSWAEVAQWLADARLGDVDVIAAEIASAVAEADVLLRARRVLRQAPSAQRKALLELIDV